MPAKIQVVELPLEITETSDIVTAKTTTANIESELFEIKVPRDAVYVFRENVDSVTVIPYTNEATPTQITEGQITIYLSDANKMTKWSLAKAPVTAFSEIQDKNKLYFWKKSWKATSDQYILVTLYSSKTASGSNSKLRITGIQVIRVPLIS